MGWDGLRNGLLLAEAGKQFDFFVTVDRSIAEQQNLATLPLPVVILEVGGNTPDDVVPLAPLIIQIASTLRPGQVISINAAGKITTITPGR
jgi:hypothetical protein